MVDIQIILPWLSCSRTLLLYEHSDLAVLAAIGALFNGAGGPAKVGGIVLHLKGLV